MNLKMKKLTKLNEKQTELLEGFAQEWIKKQLSHDALPDKEIEEKFRKFAELNKWKLGNFYWVDSPTDKKLSKAVRSAVYSAVGSAVYSAVGSAVYSAVGSAVYSAVDSAVYSAVGSAVDSAVYSAVGSAVYSAVGSAVGSAVYSAVGSAVGSAVYSAVGSYYWSNYFAFYSFFNRIEPNNLEYMADCVLNTSGIIFVNEDVYFCRKPRLLTLDENGRLHNEVQKCMEYRDGWGFYAWHGTRVPEYAITTPKDEITKELWLNEKNQEVKRVLVERVGYDRFMEWFKPETIDTWEDYKLHHISEQVDGEELRLLQMKDTSTERIYFLRVPLAVKTCREAVAWSFQLDADEYAPEKES